MNASFIPRQLMCCFLAVIFVGCSLAADATASAIKRPNVVVILADDLGYGSLSCYGSKPSILSTPHIDKLAEQGCRFTDAHTPSSVCSPTRYALMTGRYVWRTGVKGGVYATTDPLHIETTRPTLGTLFKGQGYTTAVIGKWHLGLGDQAKADFTKPLIPGPRAIGFDHDYLIAQNHGDITGVYIKDGVVDGLRSDKLLEGGKSSYGRDYMGLDAPQRVDEVVMSVLTDKAIAWIGQQKKDKPFFLYYAPVSAHNPITPSAATRGKSGCGPYGDFILDLDLSVGRIMAELDRLGFSKDTLVLFTSDNGGELGKPGSVQQNAIAAGLVMNGQLRGGKHSVFEGGFRVPYIVRWPGHVGENTVNAQTINLVDTFRTLAAAITASLPTDNSVAEDSVNVLPAWLGEKREPVRSAMVVNAEDGTFAIRQGPWRYIEGIPSSVKKWQKPKATAPQLYNLDQDIAETTNLLKSEPELVNKLQLLIENSRTSDGSYHQMSGN